MRLLPGLLVALTLGGCPAITGENPPAAAYRGFATALAQSDARTAWSLLSTGTQDELTREAQAAAKALNQPPPKDGMALAFGDRVMVHREIKSVMVTDQKPDRATLKVVDDAGGEQVVQTVLENGAWRVDLLEDIRKAHTP